MKPRVALLAGPTGTGKTALALEFARSHPGTEIINADSLAVYRGLDVGSAKPSEEERAGVPHHLLDIADPTDPKDQFNAAQFVRKTEAVLEEIHNRGARALVVGGTGFYLKALSFGLWQAESKDPRIRAELEALSKEELYAKLEPIDGAAATRIGRGDHYRLARALEAYEVTGKTPTELEAELPKEPKEQFELLVIDRQQEELLSRIEKRSELMVKGGILKETQWLLDTHPQCRPLGAVGFEQTANYLRGETPRGRKIRPGEEGLVDEITLATKQLIKRQRTWFRGQKYAKWFTLPQDEAKVLGLLEGIYA